MNLPNPSGANGQRNSPWQQPHVLPEGVAAEIPPPYSLISKVQRVTSMADDMTRGEVDAKLAAIEARGETRFAELNGKLDRIADSIGYLRNDVSAVRTDNKFTRLTIIVAVVGSVIAGIAALWVTQSNMLASFSAGIALHEAAPPQVPTKQK